MYVITVMGSLKVDVEDEEEELWDTRDGAEELGE